MVTPAQPPDLERFRVILMVSLSNQVALLTLAALQAARAKRPSDVLLSFFLVGILLSVEFLVAFSISFLLGGLIIEAFRRPDFGSRRINSTPLTKTILTDSTILIKVFISL